MTSEVNMQPSEEKKVEKVMTPARRWSGMYTVILMTLLLIFFAIHQQKQTGFFTHAFQTPEMVALYLPILVSMAAPILRVIQGRYDPARLVEGFSDLSLAIGSLWLLSSFPFNFAHLADVFPVSMHFAFAWLNNNVGRFILLLQIVIGFISALANIVSYLRDQGKRDHMS